MARCERKIVSLDGPISVGKTTLGSLMRERLGDRALFYPETGHKATGDGENPVDVWLEHPKELAAPFQMNMYCQCQSRMLLAQKDKEIARIEDREQVIVIDRSLVGNAVFAVTNFRVGNITALEFRFYRAVLACDPIMSLAATDVNVQLWAPVSTCLARLGVRGQSDTTVEQKKYQEKYFWELARTTFCALLSNISSERPHPQLVLNWENDAQTAMDTFCTILNAYEREEAGVCPLAARLSYEPCPAEDASSYAQVFDYSETADLFARANITEMMSSIALRDRYTGPRRFYIQVPRSLGRTTFSELFPLTIF